MFRLPGREARAVRVPQPGHASVRGELIPRGSDWIDVSRAVGDGAPVWPGDPPWRFLLAASIERGDAANVGEVSGSTHVGTHADAPFHVDPAGAPVDALPLDPFLGTALLVDLSSCAEDPANPGLEISAGELAAATLAASGASSRDDALPARILLATGCDWSSGFPARWRGLAPDAARWCAERGLRLVGTDAPSVDAPGAKGLPSHRALVRAGIAIVECLALAGIEAGRYEFLALPLRWSGADASPVRAVLRRIRS